MNFRHKNDRKNIPDILREMQGVTIQTWTRSGLKQMAFQVIIDEALYHYIRVVQAGVRHYGSVEHGRQLELRIWDNI